MAGKIRLNIFKIIPNEGFYCSHYCCGNLMIKYSLQCAVSTVRTAQSSLTCIFFCVVTERMLSRHKERRGVTDTLAAMRTPGRTDTPGSLIGAKSLNVTNIYN